MSAADWTLIAAVGINIGGLLALKIWVSKPLTHRRQKRRNR